MKRSTRRRRAKAAPQEQIWAALDVAILHRQLTWRAELEASDPDWARLLSLHLQLAELEHLEDAVKEFL